MFDDSFKGKKTGVVGFGSEQFIQPVVWVFTNLSMTGSDLKPNLNGQDEKNLVGKS